MTVSQDHTPDDIRTMTDDLFNSLNALHLLIRKQHMAKKEVETLDQEIQCLEDEVAMLVNRLVNLTHFFPLFRLKDK